MSKERRDAYERRSAELVRRKEFDEHWRAAKAKRKDLYSEMRQYHKGNENKR